MIARWRRLRDQAETDVRGRLGARAHVDDAVRYFGRASAGRMQLRGNGCLGASDDELLFVMWWPRREVLIDRRTMVGIDTPRTHLGKTVLRPLLRVSFELPDGTPDSAAWFVRDLGRWLEVLRGGSPPIRGPVRSR